LNKLWNKINPYMLNIFLCGIIISLMLDAWIVVSILLGLNVIYAILYMVYSAITRKKTLLMYCGVRHLDARILFEDGTMEEKIISFDAIIEDHETNNEISHKAYLLKLPAPIHFEYDPFIEFDQIVLFTEKIFEEEFEFENLELCIPEDDECIEGPTAFAVFSVLVFKKDLAPQLMCIFNKRMAKEQRLKLLPEVPADEQ